MKTTGLRLEETLEDASPSVEEIAGEVASILARRLGGTVNGAAIVKLLSVVFLDVNEAAELLRLSQRPSQPGSRRD